MGHEKMLWYTLSSKGECLGRTGLFRGGHGEEHLWYGMLHAHELSST